MTTKLSVNIKGHNTIMTLTEVYAMTLGKLCVKASEIGGEFGDAIIDILDKGQCFYKIDQHIPANKKSMFQL